MELGKGSWVVESDLVALRQRMFDHMGRYDRILTLRALAINQEWFEARLRFQYELVEIPKELLFRSAKFIPTMITNSKQNPKPGICRVLDDRQEPVFELYFDGGTERKLQIRNLRKSDCVVHATWTFYQADRTSGVNP
jgi:type II restriction enzyme